MADVFLSYSVVDVLPARAIVERLEHEGWTVFWDRRTPPGSTWPDVLQAELDRAGCVLVLWSTSAITSRWVVEEAELAANRAVLVPARLHRVMPPIGFTRTHACDLTDWDGRPDSPALEPLIEELARRVGSRRGVTLRPVEMAAVVARPSRHPDAGHLVNVTCRFHNDLDAAADLRSIEATADWPGGDSRELALRLLYDPQGLEHVRQLRDSDVIPIPVGGCVMGIQLTSSIVSTAVHWPAGRYTFRVRGWVNRHRRTSDANLRTTVDADLDLWDALRIQRHARWSDEEWQAAAFSDDAVGIPMTLGRWRPGSPAS